jgi:hypothetical protein
MRLGDALVRNAERLVLDLESALDEVDPRDHRLRKTLQQKLDDARRSLSFRREHNER